MATVAFIAVDFFKMPPTESKQWKQRRVNQTNRLGKETKAKTIFNKNTVVLILVDSVAATKQWRQSTLCKFLAAPNVLDPDAGKCLSYEPAFNNGNKVLCVLFLLQVTFFLTDRLAHQPCRMIASPFPQG